MECSTLNPVSRGVRSWESSMESGSVGKLCGCCGVFVAERLHEGKGWLREMAQMGRGLWMRKWKVRRRAGDRRVAGGLWCGER